MPNWDDTHLFPSTGRGLRAPTDDDIDERIAINVRGVVALRWVAVVGQLLTILMVHFVMGVELPLGPLLAVIGGTAALNAFLMIAYRSWPPRMRDPLFHPWQHAVGVSMLCDLVALTALLYLTGGMANPFSLFYFVNIVLAAVLLPRSWVWGLTLLAVGCVAFLNVWFQPLRGLHFPSALSEITWLGVDLVRLGSLVAYAACGSVIVLFITRIRGQVAHLEDRVRELAQARARSERLESLGTLAAGAAHELSSPLSTIAIITKEVEQEVLSGKVTEQTVQDVSTIRSELKRCREILDRMSSDAGLVIGESLMTTTVGDLVRECVDGVDPRAPVAVAMDPRIESIPLRAPLHGLSQAIRGIVKNAVDASGGPEGVSCQVTASQRTMSLTIHDSGQGIDPETLRRIGEPFFTTKEPGKGMGLGVYLARNVIERLGGTIVFSSRRGEGTTVSIQLPFEFPPSGNPPKSELGRGGGLF